MSVSVDWKPEGAVQAKFETQKEWISKYPDRLKPEKGDQCKS